jgi:PAS domain S-box-containing protein
MDPGQRRPSGKVRTFSSDELIVSKTDPKGIITYANDVFVNVSGFTESELMGQPHSIIRHPDMPRCVFKLLWDVIATGRELFAYVNNMAKNGDNYWVFAHVTPSFDANRQIVSYHSSRRAPDAAPLETIQPLYRALLEEERRHQDRKAGLEASFAMMLKAVADAGFDSYDRFIFAITPDR